MMGRKAGGLKDDKKAAVAQASNKPSVIKKTSQSIKIISFRHLYQ